MDQKKKKYRMLLMQLSCAVLLASDAAAWEYFLFATAENKIYHMINRQKRKRIRYAFSFFFLMP